jgi:hypothetical protein
MRHIERVRNLINQAVRELLRRGEKHDQSKLSQPEVGILIKAPSLKGITFGSEEYQKSKEFVKPALEHHYAKNRHHPQHFKEGINEMTLIDVLEMLLDWKASSERHNDGNILKSIEHNRKEYGISDQLARILTNTAHALDLV